MKFLFLMLFICFTIQISAQLDTVKTYFSSGNLESVAIYENNIRQGEAIFYWENGNVKGKKKLRE